MRNFRHIFSHIFWIVPPLLSVLKLSVPRMLAFVLVSRLRPKTQRSKTPVVVRRLLDGKPQQRLRFRDLRGKTLAFKKTHCVLEASLGARACVQVLCVQKTRRFAFAFLSPLSFVYTRL